MLLTAVTNLTELVFGFQEEDDKVGDLRTDGKLDMPKFEDYEVTHREKVIFEKSDFLTILGTRGGGACFRVYC